MIYKSQLKSEAQLLSEIQEFLPSTTAVTVVSGCVHVTTADVLSPEHEILLNRYLSSDSKKLAEVV